MSNKKALIEFSLTLGHISKNSGLLYVQNILFLGQALPTPKFQKDMFIGVITNIDKQTNRQMDKQIQTKHNLLIEINIKLLPQEGVLCDQGNIKFHEN